MTSIEAVIGATHTAAAASETVYDDLIIGTGMAGLTVGALLAQQSADGRRCVFSVFLHEEATPTWYMRSDSQVTEVVAAELVRLFPRTRTR